MTSRVRQEDKTKTRMYQMSELEKITGMGREAIRFYINSGLLPPPTRPSRNRAWYTDSHVKLIETIRSLQHEQFLPLKAIKSILHGHTAYEFSERQAEVIASLKDRFSLNNGQPVGSVGNGAGQPPIPKSHLRQLQELGWISDPGEELTKDDREIIALWAELRRSGLSRLPSIGPKDINYVLEAVDFMFDKELEFFREHLSKLEPKAALDLIQRGHPIVHRLFALLHGRRARMLAERLAGNAEHAGKRRTRRGASKASPGKKAVMQRHESREQRTTRRVD